MPRKTLKYILDIESVIHELEVVIELNERDYAKFSSNFMAVRTVERDLEISRGSSEENHLVGSNYQNYKVQAHYRVAEHDSSRL